MNPPFEERIRRLRSKQDEDWFALAIAAPIGILLNALLAEVRWVTPNLLTLMALAVRVICAPLLLASTYESDVAVAILLTVATVLDCMDGSLARYRGRGSNLGAFLDKALDALALVALFGCIGHRLFMETGAPSALFLSLFVAAAYLCRCYFYWVIAFLETTQGSRATAGPRYEKSFPEVTLGKRLALYAREAWRIVLLGEGDLYFLLSLALVLRSLPEAIAALAAVAACCLVGLYFFRLAAAMRLDRERGTNG